jgi:Zn-dependent protease with chaperone function
MKNIIKCILSGILLFIFVALVCWKQISERIYSYSINQAQQKYGNVPLSPEYEKMIRSIAQEMAIEQEFIIRKMNYKALREFGYNNAFVFFYTFFNCIPLCNTPFLFVSEGFFENLSLDEQRFLIGHELVHAQEHHTQYLNITLISFWMLLIIVMIFLSRSAGIVSSWHYFQSHLGKFIVQLVLGSLIFCTYYSSLLLSLAYRRHIEKTADYTCLTKLKAYDGAFALIDRWHKEFKVPFYNPYYGLFSTHPSCFERKEYCLKLKNKYERQA